MTRQNSGQNNYLLEEITECGIKATASLRRKRNHVPRQNAEVVVIQVFFLKSRNVGSNARSVRHARLRLGDGVRDDDVENFAHSAEIEEDVPTYWLLAHSRKPELTLGNSETQSIQNFLPDVYHYCCVEHSVKKWPPLLTQP